MMTGKKNGVTVSRMPMIMGPAHHVVEEPHGQGQGAGEFADDVEGEHQRRRFGIGTQIGPEPLLADPEEGDGHEHAQRQRRGGRERCRGRLIPRDDAAEAGHGDEEEDRPQEGEVGPGTFKPHFPDLPFDGRDDDLQQVVPPLPAFPFGQAPGGEGGRRGHHRHEPPGECQGGADSDRSGLPEDDLIRTQEHASPPWVEAATGAWPGPGPPGSRQGRPSGAPIALRTG